MGATRARARAWGREIPGDHAIRISTLRNGITSHSVTQRGADCPIEKKNNARVNAKGNSKRCQRKHSSVAVPSKNRKRDVVLPSIKKQSSPT